MRNVVLFFLAVATASPLAAQSLTVATMDSVAYVNSHNGIQATAHIAVTNTTTASKDFQVVRRKVGTTGLVDSNYFCWDLCYPVWANQSQGSVTIGAGATANDFSGYAYVRDSSANGQDTIWYTFVNTADANDTLQVPVVFAFNRYVSTPEAPAALVQLYPNPSLAGRHVYGVPREALRLEWVDVLGRVQHVAPVAADGSSMAPAQRGMWLVRVVLPNGVQTVKLTLN